MRVGTCDLSEPALHAGTASAAGSRLPYATAGDVTNARASYESFFELTKDADTGMPLSLQARQELARLK